MIAKKIFIFFLVFLIAVSISYSFQANSSNFKLSTGIVSSGGDIVNSSNYKNYVATGIIGGVVNSSTYKNLLGFFYTWLLADDQPCTANNQCEGGFCCSNLCSSSSCPVEAEEEAEAAAAAAAAAGGGGGAVIVTEEERLEELLRTYRINPSSIKVKIALGEKAEEILTFENTGDKVLITSLKIEGVNKFLTLSDNFFDLEPGKSFVVGMDFIAKTVGNFVGQIIASVYRVEISVPVIFEVISELILFDVKIDIPTAYSEVEQGSELKTQITLLNVGAPRIVDVFVRYVIKDLSGNIVYEETETFSVEKQISYSKSFNIHDNLDPGSYVVVVEVMYADSFAVSSQLFKVVEKKALVDVELITKNTTLMILLTFILLSIITVLVYRLAYISKRGKRKKK